MRQTLAGTAETSPRSRDVTAAEVAVIGLGYVGMTLAVALADAGMRVLGYDANPGTATALAKGQPFIRETGVEERLGELLPDRLRVEMELPDELPDTVIVCVGTPVDAATGAPDLSQFDAAVAALADRIGPGTLVVLRSTVPIGSSRALVLEPLRKRVPDIEVAFCPERTIQGRALEELRRLPQIVGGASEAAADRACELFGRLAPQIIRVSSLESAEAIKLICNAHTDLIYGFGNEVALIAEATGLDANELISSANLDYPRPDLSQPGFVGGGCLTKDPYLLAYSAERHGYTPTMVLGARRLNEDLPVHSAKRVLDALAQSGRDVADAKILLTGIAYKGRPETDDTRGAAAAPIAEFLRGRVRTLVGHDFVVPRERIAGFGIEPVALEEGFAGADAVMVLTDHVSYCGLDLRELTARMRRPGVVFDMFGVVREQQPLDGVRYLKLGRA